MLNLGCGWRFHPAWINMDFVAASPEVVQYDLRKPLPFADASCAAVYASHLLEHFPRAFAPTFPLEILRVMTPGGVVRLAVPDLEMIVRLYIDALDGALTGDSEAARRHEWLTIELLDQMVREYSGGEMLSYWMRDPMPAEDFVIARLGHEVKEFLEWRRSNASQQVARKDPDDIFPTAESVATFRQTGETHKWMYDRFSLAQLLQKTGFIEAKRCAANESRIPDFNSYLLDILEDGSVRKPDSLFMEAIKPG
jgi:SAM-dependent methyltransferase